MNGTITYNIFEEEMNIQNQIESKIQDFIRVLAKNRNTDKRVIRAIIDYRKNYSQTWDQDCQCLWQDPSKQELGEILEKLTGLGEIRWGDKTYEVVFDPIGGLMKDGLVPMCDVLVKKI